jgi:hypothetical protein
MQIAAALLLPTPALFFSSTALLHCCIPPSRIRCPFIFKLLSHPTTPYCNCRCIFTCHHPLLHFCSQRAHQAAFMDYAFGGDTHYRGKDMAAAHKHLIPHLTEEHFNAVVENFVATLQELGVAQEDIHDACKVVATTKDAVLSR